MQKKEDLIDYDFQGWPIFRMNLREILLALGAREEDGKLFFDLSSSAMDLYPRVLRDDGMGYGVDDSYIIEASISSDNSYINIFRERVPDAETKKKLLRRWQEEER